MNGREGNLYPSKGVHAASVQENEAALAELAAARGMSKGAMLALEWDAHEAAFAAAEIAGTFIPGESREAFYARRGLGVPVAVRPFPTAVAARKALYAPAVAVKAAPVRRARPALVPAPADADSGLASKLVAALDRVAVLEAENAQLREAVAAHFRRVLEVVA